MRISETWVMRLKKFPGGFFEPFYIYKKGGSMKQAIFSVGIDIGTSTTQLIFSKITIENMANEYSVPRISIVDKEVIYRSKIYNTPLLGSNTIDAEQIRKIVTAEYQKADFRPEDLSTGAVIITGETARKKNAGEVLDALSNMAGDFVVATAGPDLESVLAAKGAGTDSLSRELGITIANVDIGGGTSNIAVYRNGMLIGTSCLDIGGRLIRVKNGRITYVYERLQKLLAKQGISIRAGKPAEGEKIRHICAYMARQLCEALNLRKRSPEHQEFYTNQGTPLSSELSIQALTFSGGVADCIGCNRDDSYPYEDIGLALGKAVFENSDLRCVQTYRAKETIRATVVGAGTHTTTVSGSTISYSRDCFPLKNVPVLKISGEAETDPGRLQEEIKRKLPIYYTEGRAELVAIALTARSYHSFSQVQMLSQAILEAAEEIYTSGFPLVVVIENDIAKALGNMLRSVLGTERSVICLDNIFVNDGDYIDIGEPLIAGSVVPIVTKTLIFNN